MEDSLSIYKIQLLHPKIREEVKSIYLNKVIPALTGKVYCRFTSSLRTFEEQAVLYAQGRTKLFDRDGNRLGIITNAKPGQSFHNYGLSFDIVLLNKNTLLWNTTTDYDEDGEADWMEVVNIYKKYGYEWGGDWKFKDKPHLQKTFGYNWRKLLDKYNKGDFIHNTEYVNI